MKTDAQTIGEKIRTLRMKKGMTQIELAKGIVTPSMVSQIEADKARPSYKVLLAFAEKLEVPLDILLADVDLNLEVVSTHKWACALLASKEYHSAIPLFLDLLNNYRTQIPKLEIMIDLGECYLNTGQLDEAEKMFIRLQEIAILEADHSVTVLVLKNLGMIEFTRKRYQLAAYQWQRALEEHDRGSGEDIFLKASILYNLGLAYRCLGQIGEAIAFHEQAEQIYVSHNNPEAIGRVYLSLGQAHRMLHNLEKAIDYTEMAVAMFKCMENIRLTLQTQVSTAALYAQNGRKRDAEKLLLVAISEFQKYGNAEGEGVATVELAKVRLQLDQVEDAESLCQRARILLPEMHLYQGFVNQTLGKIALFRNQQDSALKSFTKAADCLKAFGEIGEWDATMYEIVKVHQDQGDYVRAFHVLDEIRRNSLQVLEQRGIVL